MIREIALAEIGTVPKKPSARTFAKPNFRLKWRTIISRNSHLAEMTSTENKVQFKTQNLSYEFNFLPSAQPLQ